MRRILFYALLIRLMKKQKVIEKKLDHWLESVSRPAAKLHIVLALIYAVYIVLSDAWNLITPFAAKQRWLALFVVTSVYILAWFYSSKPNRDHGHHRRVIWALITADLALATFSIYTQRGMSSRAVILFTLPIVVSSLLLKKFSILVTTLCTIALYILSAWWYFHTHFNEGYKAELAIEVGFYCVFFLILAEVLWLLIRPKKS